MVLITIQPDKRTGNDYRPPFLDSYQENENICCPKYLKSMFFFISKWQNPLMPMGVICIKLVCWEQREMLGGVVSKSQHKEEVMVNERGILKISLPQEGLFYSSIYFYFISFYFIGGLFLTETKLLMCSSRHKRFA